MAQQVPRQQVRAAFVCAATDLFKIEKGKKKKPFISRERDEVYIFLYSLQRDMISI